MNLQWIQNPNERVRDFVRYIEQNFGKNQRLIDNRRNVFYPRSIAGVLKGLRRDLYIELPDSLKNLEVGWREFIDRAEDTEWLVDILNGSSFKSKYEIHRRIGKYGLVNDREDFVIVYVDGACPGNGRQNAKGGIGVWFNHDHDWNMAKPVQRSNEGTPPTNQIAEIEAAIAALQIAKKKGIKRVAIYTDSDFLIMSMDKYIFKWLRNDWLKVNGDTVVHRQRFRKLLRLMEDLTVKWVFVRAHQGEEGNDEADRLAKLGADYY
ncbi:ribonuclease H1-like [Daphnia pulicaria]|uniref:ribonuclease H1-like n=1 Tax=Daphnia pulicaria TaxID=35523 RepID=UPI001EEC10F1|nr:ribonuclease H1-like [Daphnia pulicaria]